eukprot:1780452-Prorocentrum_lima.AAC.1
MVAGWTKGDFHQTTAVLHSRTGIPRVAAIISNMRLMFLLKLLGSPQPTIQAILLLLSLIHISEPTRLDVI